MNAKRSIYNIFFGMLSQIISIALGIMIPRLVLVNLGSESNGLLSSINQAMVYLNLLEAGIGQQHYRRYTSLLQNGIHRILTVFYLQRTSTIRKSEHGILSQL